MSSPTQVDPFADALEASRRFLLALANAGLQSDLRAKGGASDLVQETMAAALKQRCQFRGRTVADLRAWLGAILENELAMFRRRYVLTAARDVRREVALDNAADTPAGYEPPPAQLIRAERDRVVAAAVAGLPDDDRLVVTLRVRDGLEFAAIGARVGLSADAARKVFARALDQLRGVVGHTA